MDDLVKRLRRRWDWSNPDSMINSMIDERSEAADEIERLRGALMKISDLDTRVIWGEDSEVRAAYYEAVRVADEALGQDGDN